MEVLIKLQEMRAASASHHLRRVDHSDVYFHNEKLTEGLVADLDNLQRKRHRQLMARNSEITLLKMKYGVNHTAPVSGGDKRAKSAGTGYRQRVEGLGFGSKSKDLPGDRNAKISRTSSSSKSGRSISVVKPASAGAGIRTPSVVAGSTNGAPDRNDGNIRAVTNSGNSARKRRPATVAVPGHSLEDTEDDALQSIAGANNLQNHHPNHNDNEYDSFERVPRSPTFQERGIDSFVNSDSDGDDQFDFGRSQSRLHRTKRQNTPQRAQTAGQLGRGHAGPKTKTKLDVLMSKIRLEKYPTQWYTTVLPASDVYVDHRIGTTPGTPLDPRARRRRKTKYRRPYTAAPTTGRRVGKNQRESSPTAASEPAEEMSRATASFSRPSTRTSKAVSGATKGPNPPPPNETHSSVFCYQPPSTKTRRQLLEEANEEQRGVLIDPVQVALERRRQETQEERDALQLKVKTFLKSIEDMKRSREQTLLDSIEKKSVISWTQRQNTVI